MIRKGEKPLHKAVVIHTLVQNGHISLCLLSLSLKPLRNGSIFVSSFRRHRSISGLSEVTWMDSEYSISIQVNVINKYIVKLVRIRNIINMIMQKGFKKFTHGIESERVK